MTELSKLKKLKNEFDLQQMQSEIIKMQEKIDAHSKRIKQLDLELYYLRTKT